MQDNNKFLLHKNSGDMNLNWTGDEYENLEHQFLGTNDFSTTSFLNHIVGYSN